MGAWGFSTLEVRASRASIRPWPVKKGIIQRFSTLEVRASRASMISRIECRGYVPFQYPRSSGQSCKLDGGEKDLQPINVSVPSKFGPVVQVRTSPDMRPSSCVSVPSKFGPVVQADRPMRPASTLKGFSTLEVRASRAR